jgi:hypothetical protein
LPKPKPGGTPPPNNPGYPTPDPQQPSPDDIAPWPDDPSKPGPFIPDGTPPITPPIRNKDCPPPPPPPLPPTPPPPFPWWKILDIFLRVPMIVPNILFEPPRKWPPEERAPDLAYNNSTCYISSIA